MTQLELSFPFALPQIPMDRSNFIAYTRKIKRGRISQRIILSTKPFLRSVVLNPVRLRLSMKYNLPLLFFFF